MIRSIGERAHFAAELNDKKQPLAEYVTARMYESPYWAMRYGPAGRKACVRDLVKTVEICCAAMRNGSPMIIDQHTPWLRGILVDLGMSTIYLLQALSYLHEHAAELLSEEAFQAFEPIFISAMQAIAHSDTRSKKITDQANQLTANIVRQMHTVSPFWQVRFGADAVRACSIDVNYLIHYFVDAMALETKKGLLNHLPWLRELLAPSMITTAYLLDEMDLLKAELERILTPQEAAPLAGIVAEVSAALSYAHPIANQLTADKAQITAYCLQNHYRRAPLLMAVLSEEQYQHEIGFRLSYLIDAYGQDNPARFTDYVRWMEENIERFNRTADEYWTDLETFAAALPENVARQVQAWLEGGETAVSPTPLPMQTMSATWSDQTGALVQGLWKRLHHDYVFWSQVLPANEKVAWRGVLETAVVRLEPELQNGNIAPTLQWLAQQAHDWGATDAYAISFFEQLSATVNEQLSSTYQDSLRQAEAATMAELQQGSPAVSVMLAPNLVPWIQQKLLEISPYWQAEYQRRSEAQIADDVRILLGMVIDSLPQNNSASFLDQVKKQHMFLMSQGVSTAYYQQMLTFTADALEAALDAQSKTVATTLLFQAVDGLNPDHPQVALLIDHQDAIAETALGHLRTAMPQLEGSYPHGWEDAFVDLIYWLAYLSDAVSQKKQNLLMSHLLWYHSFVRENQISPELIQQTIQSLHHALTQHLGAEATPLVSMLPKVKAPSS